MDGRAALDRHERDLGLLLALISATSFSIPEGESAHGEDEHETARHERDLD